ncbi:hypothetical protein IFR05_017363 [Cadophora sp. M221]|nr:hypothetical protein IFR05_017363 [Cadophora sp. M221]
MVLHKTINICGPEGAGRATLIGRMLQVFGSDQMMMILDPLNGRIDTCDEATERLRSLGIAPTFYLPEHYITIKVTDTINWDMKEFQSIVKRLGCDPEKIPILPISVFHNDNVYEKVHEKVNDKVHEKALWYGGWMTAGKSGPNLKDVLMHYLWLDSGVQSKDH